MKNYGHDSIGNDHWVERHMIEILLIANKGNVQRKVWRIQLAILGCEGSISVVSLHKHLGQPFKQ